MSLWRLINEGSQVFTAKHHHAPSTLKLSVAHYKDLMNEMVGDQWWALKKNQSVRGLKLEIIVGLPHLIIASNHEELEIKVPNLYPYY